jgi:hypothetical protein
MTMFADGIVEEGITVHFVAGFSDIHFEGFLRESPSDPLFDKRFLVLSQTNELSPNALRLRQHELYGVVFAHENLGMLEFRLGQIAP